MDERHRVLIADSYPDEAEQLKKELSGKYNVISVRDNGVDTLDDIIKLKPDLVKIIVRSAGILGVEIDGLAAEEIALRSRGTPRIANALLRRVRDFAQVVGDGHIDLKIAKFALDKLRIDTLGLDSVDNKILRTIITTFKGGPVGANTIATAIGEDQGTFEEVYEPFLIKEGFIVRTQRGRIATELSYKHLGLEEFRKEENTLF